MNVLRAKGTSKLEVRSAGAGIIIRAFRKPPEVMSEQNKVRKQALPVSIRRNREEGSAKGMNPKPDWTRAETH